MKLNRKLNLVIPYEREEGTLYIHSTPVSREVFERYFIVIAKTFSAIYNDVGGIAAGPRVARLLLQQEAKSLGEEAEQDIQRGLIAEINRLTNVIILGEKGWETIPYSDAIKKKLLDEDEVSEVDNALTFFMVVSRMLRTKQLIGTLGLASQLWGARIVSLNSTEFITSLTISTEAATTGATVIL